MPSRPGDTLFEQFTPATVAASPVVSGWFDTAGFTNLLMAYVFTNSTGSTTLTVEGSFDGATVDTDITYTVPAPPQIGAGAVVAVLTPYIRFRLVQATADATRTKVLVRARA